MIFMNSWSFSECTHDDSNGLTATLDDTQDLIVHFTNKQSIKKPCALLGVHVNVKPRMRFLCQKKHISCYPRTGDSFRNVPMTIHMVFPATLNDTQDLYRPFHEQAKHKQSLGFAWDLFNRQAWKKFAMPGKKYFMLSMNSWSFSECTHDD